LPCGSFSQFDGIYLGRLKGNDLISGKQYSVILTIGGN
jgi:hypothetical protein